MGNKDYRFLFLEDNYRDAELIAYQLETDGFGVDMTRVETREEFIAELDNNYDIILADYTLPQFNALEALYILQERDIQVPLIVITGSISEEIAVQCIKEGAADYLLKDRIARLGQAIEQALQNKALKEIDQEQRRLTRLLRETAVALTSHLDTPEILETTIEHIQEIVPIDGVAIWLINDNRLELAHNYGYSPEQIEILKSIQPHTGDKEAQAVINWNIIDDIPFSKFKGFEFHASVPIRTHKQLYGFILMSIFDRNPFRDFYNEAVEIFSYQVAIALENAKLYGMVLQDAAELERRVQERTVELQLAKEHVEKILHSTSDAVILLSRSGVIEQANPAFTELFELANQNSFGLQIADFIESMQTGIFEKALEELSRGGTYRCTVTAKRADDTNFEADIVFSSLMSDPGLGIVCSIRDITMQRLIEIELRNALEKERELNELKTRFVSMVSHEYRTPLAVIQSSSSILQKYWERLTYEHRLDHLKRMDRQIDHMTTLMDEVLNIGKSDSTLHNYQFMPINIIRFCQEMVEQFSEISNHNIQLEVYSTDDIIADVEETMFRLAVRNLITNAIKYSDEGSKIQIKLTEQPDMFILKVTDEGIGIPDEDIPYLFDVFHRAGNVNQIKGTGLGLAIVKQAIEAHGGALNVESQLNIGTTFTITLPKNQIVVSA